MAKKEPGKPRKPKGKSKGKSVAPDPPEEADEAAARRRVSLLRHKLTRAMEDPLMRDQIVRAIRSMLTEGK